MAAERMNPGLGHDPSSGFLDEERRRQLSAELERAEQERRAALLLAAEAEARAAKARHDLALTADIRQPTRHGHTVKGRVDPLYGEVDTPASSPPETRRLSGSLTAPSQTLGARRAQLLERFLDAEAPRKGRGLRIFAGIATLALAVVGLMNFASVLDAGEQAFDRFVMPRVRPGPEGLATMAPPELLGSPEASAVAFGFIAGISADLDGRAAERSVHTDATSTWLTPSYRVRPSEHGSVREFANALIAYSTQAPAMIPSLAEGDARIRSEFAEAGINSEGLAQDALRIFGSVQGVLLAQVTAKGEQGRAILELDDFLRREQGVLTFRLGEYGHRDPSLAARAASLEAAVLNRTQEATAAASLAKSTMSDLGIGEP